MNPATLRAWQQRRTLTNSAAAEALGVTRDAYQRWLSGRVAIPSMAGLACAALEAGLAPLADDAEPELGRYTANFGPDYLPKPVDAETAAEAAQQFAERYARRVAGAGAVVGNLVQNSRSDDGMATHFELLVALPIAGSNPPTKRVVERLRFTVTRQ